MSRTFKIDRAPFGDSKKLYAKDQITFQEGITVLVGCNGSGKSTLLEMIESQLNKECIPCYSHDNVGEESRANTISKAVYVSDLDTASAMACSSEGEGMRLSIGKMAESFGYFVFSHPGMEECWLLIDAVDSGMSIDNVLDIRDFFDCLVKEQPPAEHIYIVVAGNSFEQVRDYPCLDVQSCKYVSFSNYEEYKNFVVKSRAIRDKW